MDLSPGLLEHPHDMMVGFLQRERSQRTRRRSQCLYNLASKVRHSNVCTVVRHHWSHRLPWFTVLGEHRRAGRAGGRYLFGRYFGGWLERGGFPYGSAGKESTCNAGDLGSIPGSGRSPVEGNDKPLQYSCLGNPTDRGA